MCRVPFCLQAHHSHPRYHIRNAGTNGSNSKDRCLNSSRPRWPGNYTRGLSSKFKYGWGEANITMWLWLVIGQLPLERKLGEREQRNCWDCGNARLCWQDPDMIISHLLNLFLGREEFSKVQQPGQPCWQAPDRDQIGSRQQREDGSINTRGRESLAEILLVWWKREAT